MCVSKFWWAVQWWLVISVSSFCVVYLKDVKNFEGQLTSVSIIWLLVISLLSIILCSIFVFHVTFSHCRHPSCFRWELLGPTLDFSRPPLTRPTRYPRRKTCPRPFVDHLIPNLLGDTPTPYYYFTPTPRSPLRSQKVPFSLKWILSPWGTLCHVLPWKVRARTPKPHPVWWRDINDGVGILEVLFTSLWIPTDQPYVSQTETDRDTAVGLE